MIAGTFPPLNTKENYYLCMQIYSESVWKPLFQDLVDDRTMWIIDSELADGETGTTDTTHKVVTVPYTGGLTKRYQYKLVDNPEARIYKLGFTLEEVYAIINS